MIRHSRSGKTALKNVIGKIFLEGAQNRGDGRPIAQPAALM
jgi:hypothetical protein